MNKKKYLIYVDILGFRSKANEIAEKTGFEEDVIRQNFLSIPLRKKIEEIKKKETKVSEGISEIEGSDNYVMIFDTHEATFKALGELTRIRIPHRDYGYLPLEVGLDTREINENVEVEPINRKEIIEFLKNDIINPYRKYYQKKHGNTIKETFVLLTKEFFEDLEQFDKNFCKKVSYKKETFFIANLEKIQQRCKVFKFLEKIGYSGSKLYGRIDEVYVPPLEYEEIMESLQEKRIVFITGTQEYGKTYTAVRLMWEYYNREYEPRWIRGEEEKERIEVRKRLVDIESELKPNHIIYFEDPFGKTRYERRETLEKEIGTIIDSVKKVDDVYVIITSREEVFKEFEKEKLSISNIKKFEKSLNLKKASYDYKRRKEILKKWGENEGCKWLKDGYMKNTILGSLRDKKNLPTPLKIRDFAIATIDVDRIDELEEIIKNKSEETAMAFSREIKNMADDKITALSLFSIINRLDLSLAERVYDDLIDELSFMNAWKFERILDWFKDDKIIVGSYVEFAHPSYSEAIKYLLLENGYITRINREIFSRLLIKLSEEDEIANGVAWTVIENFDKLPEDIRNKLLLKLSKKEKAAGAILMFMTKNFDKLPEDIRNKLLLKLAGMETASYGVLLFLRNNFGSLSEDMRGKLLLELVERERTALSAARTVADIFDKIPEDIRNILLFKLSKKNEAAEAIAQALADNFDKIPEDIRNKLLLKLSEEYLGSKYVAQALADNFDKIPEDIRSKLLLRVSGKGFVVRRFIWLLADNFDKIPEDIINDLLSRSSLPEDEALAIARNLDKASVHTKDLMFDLCKKPGVARYIIWNIVSDFDKVSDDTRNLLFIFSEEVIFAKYVALAIARNFDKVSEDVQNLLFKFSEKHALAKTVAWALADNFDKIPEDIRNKLLFKLSKRNEAAEAIAWIGKTPC